MGKENKNLVNIRNSREIGDIRGEIVVRHLEGKMTDEEYFKQMKNLPPIFTTEDLFILSSPDRPSFGELFENLKRKIVDINTDAALANCNTLIKIGERVDRIKKRLNL